MVAAFSVEELAVMAWLSDEEEKEIDEYKYMEESINKGQSALCSLIYLKSNEVYITI
jgi:hypothetical protein